VKTLRAHAGVPDEKIKVIVSSGWVTLKGNVDWQYEKAAAENAIRYLIGVRGLTNNLKLVPRVSASDVKDKIEAAFRPERRDRRRPHQRGDSRRQGDPARPGPVVGGEERGDAGSMVGARCERRRERPRRDDLSRLYVFCAARPLVGLQEGMILRARGMACRARLRAALPRTCWSSCIRRPTNASSVAASICGVLWRRERIRARRSGSEGSTTSFERPRRSARIYVLIRTARVRSRVAQRERTDAVMSLTSLASYAAFARVRG
jgi:hypothetical protein